MSPFTFGALNAIVAEPGEWTPGTLAADLGCSVRQMHNVLKSLERDECIDRGWWAPAPDAEPPADTPGGHGRKVWRALTLLAPVSRVRLVAAQAGTDPASTRQTLRRWRLSGVVLPETRLWPTERGHEVLREALRRSA